MSDYRRNFIPGGMYFFTIATYKRQPILTTDQGRKFLRHAVRKVKESRPFILYATVLLPDHWHLVMQLPPGDSDYSTRLKRIKQEFTASWLNANLPEVAVSHAKKNKGERGVWQPRFWEHTICSEDDLENCVDYIHWNPCKHQLVHRIKDYPWSSFHRFVKFGQYDINWGHCEPNCIQMNDNWGEAE